MTAEHLPKLPLKKESGRTGMGKTNKKDVVHEIENRPATKKKDVATDRSSEKSETEGRIRWSLTFLRGVSLKCDSENPPADHYLLTARSRTLSHQSSNYN